ncbi:MAG: hypothetical protein AB1480_10670 [Nitrospirota bacterium]
MNRKAGHLPCLFASANHLDALLSDKGLIVHDFMTHVCHELWQAIKADVKERENRKEEE